MAADDPREVGMHTGVRCEFIDPHTGTRCVLRLGHAGGCMAPVVPELADALAGVLAAVRCPHCWANAETGGHDG